MDADEKTLDLLLNEKDYVDTRVGSYLDSQVRTAAFATPAMVLAFGLIYSRNDGMPIDGGQLFVLVIALILLCCVAVLWSLLNLMMALGLLRYRRDYIGNHLKFRLDLDHNPLDMNELNQKSALRSATFFVLHTLLIFTTLLNIGLTVFAWSLGLELQSTPVVLTLLGTTALVLCVLLGQGLSLWGMMEYSNLERPSRELVKSLSVSLTSESTAGPEIN